MSDVRIVREAQATAAAAAAVTRVTAFPATIACLPVDALVSIFHFVPSRPLLLAVSLVSRRWRACALRAVTSLRVRGPEPERRPPPALYPSLTELKFSLNFREPIQLPVSIRRLGLRLGRRLSGRKGMLSFTDPLPPITHLTLDEFYNRSHLDLPIGTLRAARSTLTNLRIRLSDAQLLKDLRLPRLTALYVTLTPDTDTDSTPLDLVSAFLLAHCSSLTSLKLVAKYSHDLAVLETHLATLRLPLLTHLAVESNAVPWACIANMLAHAPMLKRATLPYYPELACLKISMSRPSPLIEITYTNFDAKQCTQLSHVPRAVVNSKGENFTEAVPADFYGHITCLSLATMTEAAWTAIRRCTSLTHLSLTALPLPSSLDVAWPRLTKLHFATKQPAKDAAAFVLRMLRAAPRLRRISAALDQPGFDPRTTSEFLPLLPILLRAGVEKLRLHNNLPLDESPYVLTLWPLFQFYVAHHGWLKVCVYARSDFDEIVMRSAWEFSRRYSDNDLPDESKAIEEEGEEEKISS